MSLFDLQERICAFTGLNYLLDTEAEDKAVLGSLNRIKSVGRYEIRNMLVVCRFANEWSDSRDSDEYRRLIQLVRSNA